jgi:hypothetical protein
VHTSCRAVACLLVVLAAGCGPVRATSVIRDAEAAVARARAADGERVAPYETISAELYLAKARDQQGRAQYGAAEDLARQSLQFAAAAVERAGSAGRGPAEAAPATITRPSAAPEQPPQPRTP